MDGQIGMIPNPDRSGSVFWFTATFKKFGFPDTIANLTKELAAQCTGSPEPTSLNSLREIYEKKTVLLAEDNIINQKVMLMMLRSHGFLRIDTAKNGAEAIHSVNNSLKEYDLILMDINMPVVDGITATIRIRAGGSRIPIIAMTANALKGDREEYIAKGVDDYIPKPVEKVFLTKILKKWLVLTQA